MSSTVSIGFSNYINVRYVLVIAPYDTPAMKRRIKEAGENGYLIDLRKGGKKKISRSVIITQSNHVILCSISPDTIARRMDNQESMIDPDNDNIDLDISETASATSRKESSTAKLQ